MSHAVETPSTDLDPATELASGEPRLADLSVLVVDCQATGASPKFGRLLEVGWAQACASRPWAELEVHSRLVAQPEALPRRIVELTGIDDALLADAPEVERVWAELCGAVESTSAGLVAIHYARFELSFFRALSPSSALFETLCTHAISRLLYPDLPRRGLRALSGYLGHHVGELKRTAGHCEATAWIWRQCVEELEREHKVVSLSGLREWMSSYKPERTGKRVFRVSREARLGLSTSPGVYRMLSKSGEVLYLGKATSLKTRVNSYFQKRKGSSERTMELLTQVWSVEVSEVCTALEASLLENDEIKRLAPPYNIALRAGTRSMAFASRDWSSASEEVSEQHCVGPLTSLHGLRALGCLARCLTHPRGVAALDEVSSLEVLGPYVRSLPEVEVWRAGVEEFCAHRNVPWCGQGAGAVRSLLRAGRVLWKERACANLEALLEEPCEPEALEQEAAKGEELVWSAEMVRESLEQVVLYGAFQVRRGRWLARLSESTVVWRPAELVGDSLRYVVLTGGCVAECGYANSSEVSQIPVSPGVGRLFRERLAHFDIATYDRLRVLTTELRRLVSESQDGDLPMIKLGERAHMTRGDVNRLLFWV